MKRRGHAELTPPSHRGRTVNVRGLFTAGTTFIPRVQSVRVFAANRCYSLINSLLWFRGGGNFENARRCCSNATYALWSDFHVGIAGRPRRGVFKLAGEAEQGCFIAERCCELHANRQPLVVPEERQ